MKTRVEITVNIRAGSLRSMSDRAIKAYRATLTVAGTSTRLGPRDYIRSDMHAVLMHPDTYMKWCHKQGIRLHYRLQGIPELEGLLRHPNGKHTMIILMSDLCLNVVYDWQIWEGIGYGCHIIWETQ